MQRNRVSTIIFTITLSFATVASAQTWVSFDVPASTTTFATGINADAVVGRYVDSAGTTHGFLLKDRSEERRVGKECRSRWSPYH